MICLDRIRFPSTCCDSGIAKNGEIKIQENEFSALLDRENVVADSKRAYGAQLEMLRDLVNYGTDLIPRCYTSSEKELKDVVLIGVLLRQIVSMLDGIELLANNGAVHAASVRTRALFEASLYIEWIMRGDADKKATYYYVHNLRKQRQWARRLVSGTPEATAFIADMPDLNCLTDPQATQSAMWTLNEIEHILSQSKFAAVNCEFDHLPGKPWYAPFGIRNLRDLAKTTGRIAEYIVFYGQGSEATHCSNYAQHVHFGKGKVNFEAIRYLERFPDLFRFSASIAIRSYRMTLIHYRPGELPAFRRKYLENWRKAFMSVPKVKYEVKVTNSW